jgi:hypothetical protein
MQAEGREVNPPSLLQFLFDRDRAYIYYALFGDPSKPEKKKVAHFFRVLIRDQARDFLVTMERTSSPKLQRLERRITFGYMRLVKATMDWRRDGR